MRVNELSGFCLVIGNRKVFKAFEGHMDLMAFLVISYGRKVLELGSVVQITVLVFT